jgi:hypothetical protein
MKCGIPELSLAIESKPTPLVICRKSLATPLAPAHDPSRAVEIIFPHWSSSMALASAQAYSMRAKNSGRLM